MGRPQGAAITGLRQELTQHTDRPEPGENEPADTAVVVEGVPALNLCRETNVESSGSDYATSNFGHSCE
jgi:hypothetical protein